MKWCHSALCALLTLIMLLTLTACVKTTGGENDTASISPTETEEASTAPPTQTPVEPSAAVSIPPNPYEGKQDPVILNWSEYVTRPHDIQPGTVLNFAAPYDVPSQLPWNCPSGGWLTGNIYESLMYMYMNDPTDIRGCIAKSWEHSDDYLTWTFHIRDGVKFTDGTPCDADAIAKAWNYVQRASPYAIESYNIRSWEASSSGAFIIHMRAPCSYIEVALCGSPFFIVSPTALTLYGLNDNRAAVGTGPYFIDSYTSGESIVLKANPDYYLEEKMPCIETVNFQFIRGQDSIVDALLNGETDGARLACRNDGNALRDGPSASVDDYAVLRKNYSGNLVICSGGVQPLWFNAETIELFRIHEVREAICRFINFPAVNTIIYSGLGIVQDSIWTKGTSGYVPTNQFYYDPDEGDSLLASVGLEASDIVFDNTIIDSTANFFAAVNNELEQAGVQMTNKIFPPESSSTIFRDKSWAFLTGTVGYHNTAPYLPWTYVLRPEALIKQCFQDIYDPDLYQKMLSEYDVMTSAATWDEMLTHCRQLTTYVQDDFGAIGGIQPPVFLALGKAFKNGVFFSSRNGQYPDLQVYYLYQ